MIVVGLMAFVMWYIARIMDNSGNPRATERFDGSPAMAVVIFGILGLVWIFGVAMVVMGGWMLRFGASTQAMQNMLWRFLGFIGVGFFALFILMQFLDYFGGE